MTDATDTDDETEIEGTTIEHTTGPYGDKGCKRALHVVHEGEDVYVPWDGVLPYRYDFRGGMPDTLDVDRILIYDGHVHAEADVEGGVVEVMPDYNSATAQFRGYDSWMLEKFDGDTTQDGVVVYEREEEDR